MKPETKNALSIFSLMLMIAGIANAAVVVIWFISSYKETGSVGFIVLLALAAAIISAACSFTLGMSTLSFTSSSRGRISRKTLSDKKTSYMKRVVILIVFSLIQMILVCVFGVKLWQAIVILVCSVIIPMLYMICASRM